MEQLITEGQAQDQQRRQQQSDTLRVDPRSSNVSNASQAALARGYVSNLQVRDSAGVTPQSGLVGSKVSQSVALDPGGLSQALEDDDKLKQEMQVGATEMASQPSHRDSLAYAGAAGVGGNLSEIRMKEMLIQNLDPDSQEGGMPNGLQSYAMMESQVRLSQADSDEGHSKRYEASSRLEEATDKQFNQTEQQLHEDGSIAEIDIHQQPEPVSVLADDLSSMQHGKLKRLKSYLIVLDKSKMLPPALPEGLVYWNRCKALLQPEAIERSGLGVTNEMIEAFYAIDFRHHEDLDGDVAKVSDNAPFFRNKPLFIDQYMKPRFVNRAEERILKDNVWPEGMRKFHIEGNIMLNKCTEKTVFFNSQFETANLRQVFVHDPKKMLKAESFKPSTPQNPELLRTVDPEKVTSFDLYLQDDTNSDNSLTQWFYFSCLNVKKGTIVKLNMLNLMKDDSLYSQGMQPFVYSRKRHLEGDGVQWHREGFNIEYYYNDLTTRTSGKTLDMAFDPRYVENMKDKFKKTSTLSFSYEFQYDNDIVFFAHFAPYSYSDVFRYMCKLEANEDLRKIMRIDHICNSLGKIPMYGMTITNNLETEYISQAQEIELYRKFEYQGLDMRPKKKKIKLPGLPGYQDPATVKKSLLEIAHEKMNIPSRQVDEKKEKKQPAPATQLNRGDWLGAATQQAQGQTTQAQPVEEEIRLPKYKKFLYLTSRVHPGETNSQYMLQGCVEFLLSDDPVAVNLRTNFVIKVIPILNPDGVIHGNYRASLMGVDLNRRWKNPSRYLHPTIYHTKSLMKFHNDLGAQFDSDSGGVVFSCDMHGHSRNMNIFMYACRNFNEDPLVARGPNQVIWSIPENVHHFCPIFSHKECKMAVEKDKEATARIVLFKELGLLNSYTLEATFHGSEHFKKPRNNWIKQLAPEETEKINERYQVCDEREDIHIDTSDLLYVGHDFLRGINHASQRKPATFHWFDNPKKTEEIKAKEAAIIAAQEKELEEIKAKAKEAARLAKQAEKERIKAQKAAEKQQLLIEARLVKMRERNIDPETAPAATVDKIDEEVQAELKQKRIKKRKARKEKEFSAWDEEAKGANGKKKDRKKNKIKKPVVDGKVMAAAFGRSIYATANSKYPTQHYGHLENGQPIIIGDGDEQSPYLSYQLMRKSIAQNLNGQGQIGMGLGDQLMMQYNKYTQSLQRPLQNRMVLGGVGMVAQQSSVHPALMVQNSKQPGVGMYGIGNSGNKMIDLVDQILYKKSLAAAQDPGIPDYVPGSGNRAMKLIPMQDDGSPSQRHQVENQKLRKVSVQLNEIAASSERRPDMSQTTMDNQHNLYYNQGKNVNSKASIVGNQGARKISGSVVKMKQGNQSAAQQEYQTGMPMMAAGNKKRESQSKDSNSMHKPPKVAAPTQFAAATGMRIRGLTNAMSQSRNDSQQSFKSDSSSKHANRLLEGEQQRVSKTIKKGNSKKLLLTSQNDMRAEKSPLLHLNGHQLKNNNASRLNTETDLSEKGCEDSPSKTYEDQRYEKYKKAELEKRKNQYDRLIVMQTNKIDADGQQDMSQMGSQLVKPGLRLSIATSQSSMTKRERSQRKKHRKSVKDQEMKVQETRTASPPNNQYDGEPSVSESSSSGSSSDSMDSEDDGSQEGDARSSNLGSRLQMIVDPIMTMHQQAIIQHQQQTQNQGGEAMMSQYLAQARDLMNKRQSEPNVSTTGGNTMAHVPQILINNPALMLKQQLAANQMTSKSPPPSFMRSMGIDGLNLPGYMKSGKSANATEMDNKLAAQQPVYYDNQQSIIQQRFAGKANSYKQGALFSQALLNHQHRIKLASDQAQAAGPQGEGLTSLSRRLQAAGEESPRRQKQQEQNGEHGVLGCTQAPRNSNKGNTTVVSPSKVKFYGTQSNAPQTRTSVDENDQQVNQESRPPRHNVPPQQRSHRKKTHLKIQNIIMSQSNQQQYLQVNNDREQRQFASLEKRRTGEQHDMRHQRAEMARKKSYHNYASQMDAVDVSRTAQRNPADKQSTDFDQARRFRKGESQANKSFGQNDRLSGNLSVGQANDPRSSDTFVQYSSHEAGLFKNQRLQELASSTNRDQNGHEASASSFNQDRNSSDPMHGQQWNKTQSMNKGYMHHGTTNSDINRAVFQTTGHTNHGHEALSEHSGVIHYQGGGHMPQYTGTTNTSQYNYSNDQYNYKSVNYNNTVKFPEIKQSQHQGYQPNLNSVRKPPHPQGNKIRRELNGLHGQRQSEDLGQGLHGRSFKNTSRLVINAEQDDRVFNRDQAVREYHGSKLEDGRTQRSINGSFNETTMSQGMAQYHQQQQHASNMRFMRSPQGKKHVPSMTTQMGTDCVRASGQSTNSLNTTPQRNLSNNKYGAPPSVSIPKTIQQEKTAKLTMSPHGNHVIFGNQSQIMSDLK